MNFEIRGLDKLQKELKEIQHALGSMNGTIARLKIDPKNAESIQSAIEQMEIAVDKKVEPYGRNELISSIVAAAKDHYREQILKLAEK